MIFIMLGGFSLFSLSKLVLSIVLSSLLALFLIINCIYKRKKGEPLLFFVLLLILFLSTTVLSFLYFNVFRTVPEKEAVIEAEIIGFDEYDYGSAYQIKCTRIDGARRNVRLILYTSEDYNEFTLGDIIVTKVSLSRFSRNDSYDAYRYSQGFVGEANHITTMITLVGHKEHPIQKAILLIRNIFHNYIDSIFGEDAGGFFLALLIGDRSLLSKACRLDFTRIGISHILALSGQHLAILSLLIHRLLSLCHINKKWRLSILCRLIYGYNGIFSLDNPCRTNAYILCDRLSVWQLL